MFFEGIRTEGQLMGAADCLSLRWYLGYDLHEALPAHSSLTKIRNWYGVTILRRFFDRIAEQCQQVELVWGKELDFGPTQVEASAHRDKMLPSLPRRRCQRAPCRALPQGDKSQDEQGLPVEPAPIPLPVDLPPDVEAELTAKNAARHNWIAELGRPERAETHGSYQRQSHIWVNNTDPDATLMHKKGGGTTIDYHTHFAVDGIKARIILDTLVTPSEVMDIQPMLDLLWHVCFRWHLQPEFACGDTIYVTIVNIMALENANIHAYTPLPNSDQRTGFFGKQRFTYEAD